MNTDFECTLYVVDGADGQSWLDIPLHVLRCIPLTDDAKKHIVGSIEFCNRDMVIGKGLFVKEIKEWNSIHHQLKIRSHVVNEHNMLWHLYSMTRCIISWTTPTHPITISDKELTFPQLVSYRLVQYRDGCNIKRKCWSRDTFMLTVEYDNGGGITLGIEPDGYCHS